MLTKKKDKRVKEKNVCSLDQIVIESLAWISELLNPRELLEVEVARINKYSRGCVLLRFKNES